MIARPAVALTLFAFLLTPSADAQSERRWIIDSAASLAEAKRSSKAGDVLLLRASSTPYRGPIVLKSGQSLIGEGTAPAIAADEGAVVTIAATSGEVTVSNISIQAGGNAGGLVVRDTAGVVTLRDVVITTAGGAGIRVAKAARFAAGGASTVSATNAAAVEIAEAELDVVFRSVSARGERLERGIVLEKTTGRFVVEGTTGVRGSGGTIEGASARGVSAVGVTNLTLRSMILAGSAKQNGVAPAACGGDLGAGNNHGCNAAVYLRDVAGALLEGVAVDGSGQAGIVAHGVSGFALVGSEVRGAGNELFEHGVVLQEMSGECRIADTSISHSASRHLMLHNSDAAVKVVIENATFADNRPPHGQQSVLVSAGRGAAVDLQVRGSSFSRSFSHALDVVATDEAKVTVHVTGNKFDGQASAISLSALHAASIDYVVADNPTITGSTAAAINVYLGTPSSGRLSGTIARNVIGRSGAVRSGTACNSCSGVSLTASGKGVLAAAIQGNIIQQTGGPAIVAGAGPGGASMQVTITSNLLREPANPTAPAIRISASASAADTNTVCAGLGGPQAMANTIEGAWEPGGAIQLLHRFGGARFQLVGLTGGNGDAAAAAAIAARNRGVKVRAVLRPDSEKRGFEPAAECRMPALTP